MRVNHNAFEGIAVTVVGVDGAGCVWVPRPRDDAPPRRGLGRGRGSRPSVPKPAADADSPEGAPGVRADNPPEVAPRPVHFGPPGRNIPPFLFLCLSDRLIRLVTPTVTLNFIRPVRWTSLGAGVFPPFRAQANPSERAPAPSSCSSSSSSTPSCSSPSGRSRRRRVPPEESIVVRRRTELPRPVHNHFHRHAPAPEFSAL